MTEMRLPAGLELLRPLISGSGRVEPAWIDHHNHMNVGYYGVAIDACLHGFGGQFGISIPKYKDIPVKTSLISFKDFLPKFGVLSISPSDF